MQDDVGLGHLLQRCPKGSDQFGRQIADEADRVGEEDHLAAGGQLHATQGRVKRREELILGKGGSAG